MSGRNFFINPSSRPVLIGLAIGNLNFSNLFTNLGPIAYDSAAAAEEAGAPIVKYGVFIQTVFDFLIVAFVIFMVIKGMNNMKKKEEEAPAAPPEPSDEVKLLSEIRDALKQS